MRLPVYGARVRGSNVDADSGDPGRQRGITILTAADGENQKITWGEPAQITQARMDNRCPRCGAKPKDPTGLHMEFIERRTAGYCYKCEWSFQIGV